jgi:cbb3-type cytochrome oxidase subunit 3
VISISLVPFIEMITPFEIEGIIKAMIVVFALLLLAVSISAYKRLRVKKMAYAAGAFSLFAIQLLYEYLEQSYHLLDEPYPDTILAIMTLGILVLFFVAILKKDKRKIADEI